MPQLIRIVLRVLALLIPLACVASAQTEFKVYISADMEGIGGVVSRTQTSRDQMEYERFRGFMTAEVNAAIEGALAAGATQIVVSDSHGRGENLLVEQLNPVARLVRAFPRPLDMMEGIDSSFAATLLIGYHGPAGARDAVIPHTLSHRILSMKVNGRTMSEGTLSAAVAGHFGVPVALVTGDRATVEDLRMLAGPVPGVEVKVAHGANSATTVHPSVSQSLIRDATRQALLDRAKLKPYVVAGPLDVEVTFVSNADAEVLSWMPGVSRVTGNSIRVRLPDIIAVTKFMSAAMFVNASAP